MDAHQVIIEPILTEKSNEQREVGVYTFHVSSRANKIEIKRAVAELFGVHPVNCRTIWVKSKPKRTRIQSGRTAQWKKAVVTLAEGERIHVFEGA